MRQSTDDSTQKQDWTDKLYSERYFGRLLILQLNHSSSLVADSAKSAKYTTLN